MRFAVLTSFFILALTSCGRTAGKDKSTPPPDGNQPSSTDLVAVDVDGIRFSLPKALTDTKTDGPDDSGGKSSTFTFIEKGGAEFALRVVRTTFVSPTDVMTYLIKRYPNYVSAFSWGPFPDHGSRAWAYAGTEPGSSGGSPLRVVYKVLPSNDDRWVLILLGQKSGPNAGNVTDGLALHQEAEDHLNSVARQILK